MHVVQGHQSLNLRLLSSTLFKQMMIGVSYRYALCLVNKWAAIRRTNHTLC